MSNLILPAKYGRPQGNPLIQAGQGALTLDDVEFAQQQAREVEENVKRYPYLKDLRQAAWEIREMANAVKTMYERQQAP